MLTEKFYIELEIILREVKNSNFKTILKNINWEKEAQRCYDNMVKFFGNVNVDYEIGVIDIRWNEYDGDIQIDFLPDNNFETAFDNGHYIIETVVENDDFFSIYFKMDSKNSWHEFGDDYDKLINIFYFLIVDVIMYVAMTNEFKKLNKKIPYYVGFAYWYDDESEIVYAELK